ncbi:MAG: hypothetical protein ACXVKA_06480 [Acidimicrobiia bacterium]
MTAKPAEVDMREAVVHLVISHGDGAEADPQLELEVVLFGNLGTTAWRAVTVRQHSVPPSLCIDGPVVATIASGPHSGERADGWAQSDRHCGVAVTGVSPFCGSSRTPR